MSLAVGVPALLAFNAPPSATFLNQAAALIGWAMVLLMLVPALHGRRVVVGGGAGALLVALGLSALACAASMAWFSLPWPLGLSALGIIAAAALTCAFGAALAPSDAVAAFRALALALLIAGVLSVAIGLVQAFAPDLADGTLVAAPAFEGRASGNLRQPNHLSTLLLWSMIGLVWLLESGQLRFGVALGLAGAFVLGIVLTASRTGLAGTVLLLLWGVLDRRLSRPARTLLCLTVVAYVVCWGGLTLWSQLSHHAMVESRLTDTAESPNSRLRIWANALALIAQHPWLGVGFGEFNFAWSLMPFPQRPTAFFDHTHNLPLQLVAEMGIPLGGAAFVLLLVAMWRAFVATCGPAQPRTTMLRAAFMIVLMAGLHSLLEYPLWYAYFLLPTAFAWGLCFGASSNAAVLAPRAMRRWAPAAAASAMLALSVASVVDYARVVAIFTPDDATPLAERIARGERSWLFAHHAWYAAATIAEHPSEEMPAFGIATHYLLDTRLMMAWANALDEAGDVERARYLAARLREFRNEDAKAFFAPCDEATADKPFQCTPPSKTFTYADFK